MEKKQGFSFIEVLISLLLVSGTAVTLLNHQTQVRGYLLNALQKDRHFGLADNALELHRYRVR